MIPVLLKIGPLTIGSFGVMAMLAFLVPTFLMRKDFPRVGVDPELSNGVTISAMVGGFLGARIYFILERWETFFADPAIRFGVYAMLISLLPAIWLYNVLRKKNDDAVFAGGTTLAAVIGVLLAAILFHVNFLEERSWGLFLNSRSNLVFTGAGLVWYGGFIGGFIMVIWYVYHSGVKVPLLCDLMAPLLALGQTFGRMGCLLSGDGDYGPPTDLPWAMSFPEGLVPTMEKVHPTPIYDMIFLLAIFVLLWNVRTKKWPTGFKFSLYLIMIGLERVTTEIFRNTPKIVFGFTMAQLISFVLIVAGVTWIVLLRSKQKAAEPQKAKAS
ncbi:MAG: prolipoprotein diacylglyceryl transferase [bacterium]